MAPPPSKQKAPRSAVTRRSSTRRGNIATPTVGANNSPTVGHTNTNANNSHRDAVTNIGSTEPPMQRSARDRKPRTTYSPSVEAAVPKRPYRRRQDAVESALSSGVADEDLAPDERCRRLEARVRSHVKQLRYLQTFLEAYEAEGWRHASREKLKPSKELAVARRKMAKAKRRVVETLHELDALRQRDPPIPYLIEMETQPLNVECSGDPTVEDGVAQAERIYCSRCSSTVTSEDNDILLCDSEGCFRAFHQQCQVPVMRTDEIPQGDEPWFCVSCLAVFNALKAINNACDTTYEKISDVFPDLSHEEQALLGDEDYYDASTAEGTAEEEDKAGEADDEDDEEDEDYVVDEARLDADGISSSENSDSGEESGDTSADDGVLESDVSEDELKHLHNDDVIDTDRRSRRSRADPTIASQLPVLKSHLGQRVAKKNEGGAVVFGVIVEKDWAEDSLSPWRVVYYDDSMAYLNEQAVEMGMALATEYATHHETHPVNDVDPQTLILRGKRKRSRVDYRALNDMMFDGKEDSDAGGDEHMESESEDDGVVDANEITGDDCDDDDFEPPTSSVAKATAVTTDTVKRGRRERRAVDYRAMHEGLPGL